MSPPAAKSSPRLTGIPGGLALTDGLMNVVTGAGTSRDRGTYTAWSHGTDTNPIGAIITASEIDAA